jgi:hypothetical protein
MSAYLRLKREHKELTSHKLVAILLEEDCHCCEHNGDPCDVAMHGRRSAKGRSYSKSGKNMEKECYNYHRKGHLTRDCWSKGGGKE